MIPIRILIPQEMPISIIVVVSCMYFLLYLLPSKNCGKKYFIYKSICALLCIVRQARENGGVAS